MVTLIDGKKVKVSENTNFGALPRQEQATFFKSKEDRPAALVSRNIIISGRRTSIRLEPSMWDALEEVCVREQCNIHQICTLVSSRLSCSSFTAAVRVFVLSYYRAAATELGHAAAGHGQLRGLR